MNNIQPVFISPSLVAFKFNVGKIKRGIGTDSDTFTASVINDQDLFDASHYRIRSTNDASFSTPLNPLRNRISLKTKTTDVAFLDRFNPFDPNQVKWAQEYTVYLQLPETLKSGKRYTLDFVGDLGSKFQDKTFSYQPQTQFSEAIHVSQIGFDPNDPKLAFLSQWLGRNQGNREVGAPANFKAGLRFWIIDAQTGDRVEDARVIRRTKLSLAANQDEDIRDGFQNFSGTDVYEMEFSDFKRPGEYAIEVEGVGRSFDFEIAENTWERAFQVSMKGLYNQRSGTAIGGPFSDTKYERSFHPDDGVLIFPTDDRTVTVNGERIRLNGVQLIDTQEGLNLGSISFADAFKTYTNPLDSNNDDQVTSGELAAKITPLTNAWGGYKDAGDWDRRIQHLFGTRTHLELLELFPDYFETVDLNLPETTRSFATQASLNQPNPDNGIPDLLDESLWSLDFYRRLQTADGGIRGGIESANAPRAGETSWQESLNVYAYAPDPWSSYIYAGVAARAARVLKDYNVRLATVYEKSAIRAMNWAEAEVPTDPKYDNIDIRDERNLAALELYLLTQNNRWNNIFLEDTVFTGDRRDITEFEQHDQRQSAFLYARAPQNLTNNQIRLNASDAIERAAANAISIQNGGPVTFGGNVAAELNGTAFKWTAFDPFVPRVSGQLATPQVENLLQAYTLTKKRKYLNAAILGTQFSTGANPSNLVFTAGLKKIGLADRELQNPFVIDARLTGQKAPAGVTAYGPVDFNFGFSNFQTDLFRPFLSPQPEQWPIAEAFFDNYWNFQSSEFTIHESIAPTAYTWGYFAASDFQQAAGTPPSLAAENDLPNVREELASRGTFGNDLLLASLEQTVLKGYRGDDVLRGHSGNDLLLGGQGQDQLVGGAGNDILDGQAGVDILKGEAGEDTFVLRRSSKNDGLRPTLSDRIQDFVGGEDRLELKGGLSFERLSFTQVGNNVLITDENSKNLSLLLGTNVSELSVQDFIQVQ
jgi:endoglucanase